MQSSYSNLPDRIRDLNGLGPKSESLLTAIGIHTVKQFMAADPYQLYAQLKSIDSASLNFLYAILGARENLSWLEIKNTRKMEILLRLDDMGLAPK